MSGRTTYQASRDTEASEQRLAEQRAAEEQRKAAEAQKARNAVTEALSSDEDAMRMVQAAGNSSRQKRGKE